MFNIVKNYANFFHLKNMFINYVKTIFNIFSEVNFKNKKYRKKFNDINICKFFWI